MKRYAFLVGLLALFCCSTVLAADRTTVTKDNAGTMSHVTRWVTESGVTIIEVTASGVSMYANTYNNVQSSYVEQGVTGVGTSGQIAIFSGTTTVAGSASISGNSLVGGTLSTTSVISTYPVNAGTSIFEVQSGTTLTAQMLSGGIIYITTPSSGSTPTVIGIPTISGTTIEFLAIDLNGNGVTLQTTNSQALYYGVSAGTKIFIPRGYSRAQVAFKCVTLSGTCTFANVIGTGSVGTWSVK